MLKTLMQVIVAKVGALVVRWQLWEATTCTFCLGFVPLDGGDRTVKGFVYCDEDCRARDLERAEAHDLF